MRGGRCRCGAGRGGRSGPLPRRCRRGRRGGGAVAAAPPRPGGAAGRAESARRSGAARRGVSRSGGGGDGWGAPPRPLPVRAGPGRLPAPPGGPRRAGGGGAVGAGRRRGGGAPGAGGSARPCPPGAPGAPAGRGELAGRFPEVFVVSMDFDGGFASLWFRESDLEDAALVGRGPDPAGTFGGRSIPLQEFLLGGRRRAGGTAFATCSLHLNHPHRAGMSDGFLAPISSCLGGPW